MSDQLNANASQQQQQQQAMEKKLHTNAMLPGMQPMPQPLGVATPTSTAAAATSSSAAAHTLGAAVTGGTATTTTTTAYVSQVVAGEATTTTATTTSSLMPTTTMTATINTTVAAEVAARLSVDPMAAGPKVPRITKKPVEVVSHATVDALGDYLDSATHVRSFSAIQEQRRRESYKSGHLINKTMRQSQQERRRQALLEQTKRRHQLVNHARRLALFSSEGVGESSDEDEGSGLEEDEETRKDEEDDLQGEDDDSDDEEEEEDDDEDEEDDGEEQDDADGTTTKRRKAKKQQQQQQQQQQRKGRGDRPATTAGDGDGLLILHRDSATRMKQKRRLSSGSESESTTTRRGGDMTDMLSPKKPRLQRPSPMPKRKRTPKNPFKDQLMIPEPMTEIPDDLDTNYYIIPIPTGHRCFLISSDGRTTARLPSGQLLVSAFESCLPAGSSTYKGNRKTDYCILDCVYSPRSRTFWTLDIMCWRGHPVYECETEFRFWWLRGKLAEIESLQQRWIQTQTRTFETEETKRRLKWTKRQDRNARRWQYKQGQERLQQQQQQTKEQQQQPQQRHQQQKPVEGQLGQETAVGSSSSSTTISSSSHRLQDKSGVTAVDVAMEDDEDGESLSDTGMELEDLTALERPGKEYIRREFWPISFTPLPYFNASTDLVRLLAESMHVSPSVALPSPSSSTTPSPQQQHQLSAARIPTTTPPSLMSVALPTRSTTLHTHLGTMALSGEIAEAAALFPAHDLDQRRRQETTLVAEQAAGLAFYNKKTMYVLGTTPLCGWVAMEQIGDVFFGEEGGVGAVPGTRAVEGREIEMEGALERITLSM
ncbi:hypothetical protein DFQ27_007266 [Actinomortierella ambigua]|uniref:Snurportin-1 n=1 Tax=Actinomortierella ambigua TaxID=1343610 RepID=A0A9P6PWN8_9FUNG|nr:hypothetical protein DFQ27_007266 [Actinomortierella ambigua]